MVKKGHAIGCVIPRIALDGLFLVSSKDYVSSSFESSSGPLWPVTSRMRNSIDKDMMEWTAEANCEIWTGTLSRSVKGSRPRAPFEEVNTEYKRAAQQKSCSICSL